MAALSRLAYLEQMGIDVYLLRRGERAPVDTVPADAQAAEPAGSRRGFARKTVAGVRSLQEKAWQQLEQEVSGCVACALHKSRSRTVFGVGDLDARWMFVGEGPGFEEDRQGEPFVGRAGKLLDKMIKALGLDRRQVYIANTVKCRPPENRNPRPEELAACNGYLQRQIALVQPWIIVALGGVAATTLLAVDAPVGRLRGEVHGFGSAGIPLVVTYHPAYLLRAPQQKKAAWEDLQLAQRVIADREAT